MSLSHFLEVTYFDDTNILKITKTNVSRCVRKEFKLLVKKYARQIRAVLLYFDVIITRMFNVKVFVGRVPFDTVIFLTLLPRAIRYRRENQQCSNFSSNRHLICQYNVQIRLSRFIYCGTLPDPNFRLMQLRLALQHVFKIPLWKTAIIPHVSANFIELRVFNYF